VVKLAASMSPCPNASRHNKELAANASIATVVSNAMLPEIDLKFPERITATLVSIYDAYDSEENFHSLTPPDQPNRYTPVAWFLDVLAHVNVCFRPEADISPFCSVPPPAQSNTYWPMTI